MVHKNAYELIKQLDKAFEALRADGYYAAADFWCCQSCALNAIPDENSEKYVYYHNQDKESIEEVGCCYLGWNGDGLEICKRLTEAGLAVDWNGLKTERIAVSIPVMN